MSFSKTASHVGHNGACVHLRPVSQISFGRTLTKLKSGLFNFSLFFFFAGSKESKFVVGPMLENDP